MLLMLLLLLLFFEVPVMLLFLLAACSAVGTVVDGVGNGDGVAVDFGS